MYFKYFKSLMRHKWFVFKECCKLGIPIRGLLHDSSKFLPSEFIPYARYFYGDYMLLKDLQNIHGDARLWYNGPTREEVNTELDRAWLKHQNRNKHHWQYWMLVNDDDGMVVTLKMPRKYIKEMVADWIGAGIAFTGKDNVINWYAKNKDNMRIDRSTRKIIEELLICHELSKQEVLVNEQKK